MLVKSMHMLVKREFAKPYVFGQTQKGANSVGNLFSPEILSAKELSLGLNKIATMEIATEEISRRYGRRVVEISGQMKSKDIAMTLNALVKLPRNSETSEAVDVLVKLLPARLMHFAPLEISLVLNALAKLSIKDGNLMMKFASEIPHKLEFFGEDNFAQTVHALARLGYYQDALLISDFSEFFRTRVGNFDAQQLFMIANAFGRFVRHGNHDIFPILLTRASEIIDAFQPHQGPLIIMAAASADSKGPELEKYAEILSRKISDPKHALVFLSALAKLRLTGSRFGWDHLLKKISDHPPKEVSAVVQLLYALGKRGVQGKRSSEIVSKLISDSILPEIEKMDGNQLAIVAYALGNLNLSIPAEVELKITSLVASEAAFSGSALAMVSFSLAQKSPRLAHLLSRKIKISDLSAKSLAMVMHGMGTGYPDKLKTETVKMIGNFALNGKLRPEEARSLLDGARKSEVEISEDLKTVLIDIAGSASKRERILDSL